MYNIVSKTKGSRMKNLTLLSLAAAAVLFTACGEETKKAAAEATAKATETVKETTSNAVEATKEAAANAAEATKEAAANAAKAAAEKAAEAKAAAEEKAAAAAEALKERAAAATEAAKEKASEAVEATKEAASNVVEATKEAASDAAAAVTSGGDVEKGKALFAKCAGCHGADGKTKALGKSAIIAGEPADVIEKKLHEYKAGTRNVAGMGMLMKGQVASLSDDEIKALAAYIASLK
jgi:cytochrome c553